MSRCRHGGTINSCEFGYPGCVCADEAMAEIERMGSVLHEFVPGGQYGACERCDLHRKASVHTATPTTSGT